jgi:hypothetical protein
MTNDRLKKLQEVAKSKGKTLLIENSIIDFQDDSFLKESANNKLKIEILKEGTKVTEKINGKEITCRGIIRNVPVTRFTENKNGRIYPKRLWERIAQKGTFNNKYMLADHAEKEGSVRNIVGVWRNFTVLEEVCVADIYCVGELGELFLECVMANAQGGISSVGMGDFLDDGKTVNPDTYELSEESVADWVLNPSQSVYASLDVNEVVIGNREDKNKTELKNSNSQLPTNKIEENVIMNNNKNMVEENLEESTKGAIMTEDVKSVLKFQESNIKLRVKESVRASKKLLEQKDVDSLKESKENLKDLLATIPASLSEQVLQIESQIEMIEETISEIAKAKLKELDTTSNTLGETNTKLAETEKQKAELETKLTEAESIVSKLKEDTDKSNTELKEALSTAVNDVIKLIEQIKVRDSDIAKFEESYVNLKEDVELLRIKGRKWKEAFDKTLNNLNAEREENQKAISIVERLQAKLEGLKEENEVLREMNLGLKKSIRMKEGGNIRDGIDKKPGYTEFAGTEDEELTINEPSKLLQYEVDKNKKYQTVESTNSSIRAGLEKLYIKESAKNPSIKTIKKEILNADSFIEAMSLIEGFVDNGSFNEKGKLKESVAPSNGYFKDQSWPKGWD